MRASWTTRYASTKELHASHHQRPFRRHRHDRPGLAPEQRAGGFGRHQPAPADLAVLPGAAVRQAAPQRTGREHPGPRRRLLAGRKAEDITVADIIAAVDEAVDATGCGGRENCMGDDTGRCMTHELWTNAEHQDVRVPESVNLRSLVDDQRAKGIAGSEPRPSSAPSPASRWSSPSA